MPKNVAHARSRTSFPSDGRPRKIQQRYALARFFNDESGSHDATDASDTNRTARAPSHVTQGYVDDAHTLVIALEDAELADFLGAVPEATAFIREALSSSPTHVVGVHCHAGASRSAAIVAAYLMRHEGLDSDSALEVVGALGGCPNDGFAAQLALWGDMGCKISTANEAYKLWSVAKIARERDERGYVASTSVMRDPGAPGAEVDPEGGGWVSCRKCRRRLARGAHVLPHQYGRGMNSFSWKTRRKEAHATSSKGFVGKCSSMFITPLSWMRGIEDGDGGDISGKLTCPGCDTKIGAFAWSGIQCSCGAWVSPAFQIQHAKTDAFGI